MRKVLIQQQDYGFVQAAAGPLVLSRAAITLPVRTETAPTNVALAAGGAYRGFAAIGRVHPRGLPCTWWVEYGPTTSYGTTTSARALPGILGAYYEEEWTGGVAGYKGGLFQTLLAHQSLGFVRYMTEGVLGDDDNHIEGIGWVQLPLFGYLGRYDPNPGVFGIPKLAAGYPDIRGAKLELRMRGSGWRANGVQLATWVQRNLNDGVVIQGHDGIRRTNWVNTGHRHAWAARSGGWNTARWTLANNPHEWTYAGRKTGDADGDHYWYQELDTALGDNEINMFPVIIIDVDPAVERPTGNLDFARFKIRYRQHSVCASTNGGTLTSSPVGGSGTVFLTDGWRNGLGREWISAAAPSFPLDFIYAFDAAVAVDRVMLHNATSGGCRAYEVALSSNGVSWTTIGTGDLPLSHTDGPNFLYAIVQAGHTSASHLRVRITSAWAAGACRLGEIEAFGTGATEETDDDWYEVNRDIVATPGTYHFRVVAQTADGTAYGPDETVVVPAA